jgi:WD40 repeat protein
LSDSGQGNVGSGNKNKIKVEKPFKTFDFENMSDNFYLNCVDIWDSTRIALGTKTGVEVFDCNKVKPNQFDTENEINQGGFYSFKMDSQAEIYTVKFCTRDKLFISDANYNLKVKDFNKDMEILKFDIIHRKFLSIDFYSEHVLFLGSDNANVDFYDMRQKSKLRNLYKHENNNEVCKVRLSKTNNFLISGGNDNKVMLFDLRKEKIISQVKHKAAIKALGINEGEGILASGGGTFDKCIKLFDLKKLSLISEHMTDSQITNIEFISQDRFAVSSGYISNNIILYDIANGKNNKNEEEGEEGFFNKISLFEKHNKRILFMAKSKDNSMITSCSTDGILKVWKVGKYMKNVGLREDAFYCGIR